MLGSGAHGVVGLCEYTYPGRICFYHHSQTPAEDGPQVLALDMDLHY